MSSVTVHGSICKLRRAAKYMAPALDLTWLSEIGKDLALIMRPRSKFGRVVLSEVLAEAGLTVIEEAEAAQKKTDRARAYQVRNGLMVALLALCPIRRKNFAALEIGRSFVKIRDSWWIVLSASETKMKRADERAVPELLTPAIDSYITKHRAVLAKKCDPPPALWLSSDGAAISDKEVANVIRATTLSTVGVAVSPHLFRTCGASTAAIYAGENPHLASALLDHTDPRLTNANYNRGSSLSAAENFRQIVRQYDKPD